MKYVKKPIEIEAVQWFAFGDHPDVTTLKLSAVESGPCGYCSHAISDHGWISTLEGGHVVCPGDWIITGVKGEKYPIKDAIFRETYEPVDEATS